jgi:diguanylate cyclase (GGDEF)-like protein
MAGTTHTVKDGSLGRIASGPRSLAAGGLVILGFLGLIWGGVWFMLAQGRATAEHAARLQTATLAHAYAESADRIATLVDRHLLALRAAFADKGDAFRLETWVRTQSSPDPLTAQISIADARGVLIHSMVPASTPGISIADRAHFKAHVGSVQDRMFISAPVVGRVSGKCSIQFSRSLTDAAGAFAGVGVISLGCEDLSRFFSISDGFVLLSGLDGVIRAFGPAHPDLIGGQLGSIAGLADLLAGDQPRSEAVTVPWDGGWHIVSARRVEHYPLAVMAAFDEARVFREYRPMRERALEIGAAATAIIMLLGGIWLRLGWRLAASRRVLLVTLEHMNQGILMIDAKGRVPVVNRRAVELLDLPPALLAGDGSGSDLEVAWLTPPAEETADLAPHHNGRIIETFCQALPDGGTVRTFTDVTERRIADARIRHLALHDPLTGLANRICLTDRVEAALKQPEVSPFALVCFDLDGFKVVNDTIGHDAGDRLLVDVSRRILGTMRGEALLTRIGGDEFAVFCPDQAHAWTTAEAILDALRDPLEIDGTQFRISASLGLAFHPDDGRAAADLLRHADTAMYQAKARGRGLVVRYDATMDQTRRERIEIERELRVALREGTLEVWFQPRFQSRPSRISGFEALVRWRHPERGFIPPSKFIPIAEQCGLIAELGQFVLRDAAAFAASLPNGRIAVNLSPVQFLANNLPGLISDVLAANHLTPDRMELEVTEGVLIADEAQALAVLTRLHELGLELALDDFGTGYASLSYLRRFPFDRIKIDQSFVQAQEHDATTRAIIESVLTMAERLQLEVTAEGVETERQMNLLISQGCPELQGYYLGRPMPAWEARAFHASHNIPAQRRELFDLTAA